ncbi:MAG: hypothetical protein ACMXYD_01790 [Candidatus Woesearchaeota archaeon]
MMKQEEILNEIRAVACELAATQTDVSVQKQLLLVAEVIQEDIDLSLRTDRIRDILRCLEQGQDMSVRAQLWNLSALIEQL